MMHFDIKAAFFVLLFITMFNEGAAKRKKIHTRGFRIPKRLTESMLDNLSEKQLSYLYKQLSDSSQELPIYARNAERLRVNGEKRVANQIPIKTGHNLKTIRASEAEKQASDANYRDEEKGEEYYSGEENGVSEKQAHEKSEHGDMQTQTESKNAHTYLHADAGRKEGNSSELKQTTHTGNAPEHVDDGPEQIMTNEEKEDGEELSNKNTSAESSNISKNTHSFVQSDEQPLIQDIDQKIDQSLNKMLAETNSTVSSLGTQSAPKSEEVATPVSQQSERQSSAQVSNQNLDASSGQHSPAETKNDQEEQKNIPFQMDGQKSSASYLDTKSDQHIPAVSSHYQDILEENKTQPIQISHQQAGAGALDISTGQHIPAWLKSYQNKSNPVQTSEQSLLKKFEGDAEKIMAEILKKLAGVSSNNSKTVLIQNDKFSALNGLSDDKHQPVPGSASALAANKKNQYFQIVQTNKQPPSDVFKTAKDQNGITGIQDPMQNHNMVAPYSDYKYLIIYRVEHSNNQSFRIVEFMKELRKLCGPRLSMCEMTGSKNMPSLRSKNRVTKKFPPTSLTSFDKKSQPSTSSYGQHSNAIEKILRMAMSQIMSMQQSETKKMTSSQTTVQTTRKTMTTTNGDKLLIMDEPVMVLKPQSGNVETGGLYLGEKAVWIGILVGCGISLLIIMLLFACYKCLLHYKAERQNEQLQRLYNGEEQDERPMHITMSKMSKNKNGNHYVVSILNDKKEADGWSSEEEVFNVSGSKEPSTSTPIGTPVKKKPGL